MNTKTHIVEGEDILSDVVAKDKSKVKDYIDTLTAQIHFLTNELDQQRKDIHEQAVALNIQESTKPNRDAGRLFPGEKEAIDAVLQAGAAFGYGNMISRLREAWRDMLMEKWGFSQKDAEIAAWYPQD
jgi:hypothetical protein